MSYDVGDAFEATFHTTAGATVTVSWFSPAGATVLDAVSVAESTVTPGDFPFTFTLTEAGVWEARWTASGTVTAVERFYVRARAVSGLPPLATVGEVAELYGTMTEAQEQLTAALLRRASEMIRGRRDIADRIAAGTLQPDDLAMTAINMVLRVLRNPNGLRAETTGPFSRTYDTSVAAGLLVLADYDLEALEAPERLPDGLAGLGVGTIRVQPGLAPPAHPSGGHVRYRDRGQSWAGWP